MKHLSTFFLSTSFCVALSASAQQHMAPLPAPKNNFIVISHRGNHVSVPENTVASATEAIKAGADYVETDLRTTKDGFLIVLHDASVDRMTNGRGNVKDLVLDTIKRLEIHGKETNKVFRIPEFKEILNACRGHINIYLDFKDADVAETYRQIQQAGMEKHVVVYLNKESQYAQWRKVAPEMPLMTSLPANVKNESEFDKFIQATPIEVLDNVYDTTMTAVVNKRGVAVWIDVESKDEGPSVWGRAINKTIQGAQTDHPVAFINYLRQNGLRR